VVLSDQVKTPHLPSTTQGRWGGHIRDAGRGRAPDDHEFRDPFAISLDEDWGHTLLSQVKPRIEREKPHMARGRICKGSRGTKATMGGSFKILSV